MSDLYTDLFGTVRSIAELYDGQVVASDIYSGIFAEYYDMLPAPRDEIESYTREAFLCGRKVLELCCGNGRLTTEFAKQGFFIDGVDMSGDMLALLERRKADLPAAAARRIHTARADLFALEETACYDFAFLPATTICLFAKNADAAIRLLNKVSRLLRPGGRFMFDLRLYPSGNDCRMTEPHVNPIFMNGNRTLVIFQEQLDFIDRIAVGNFYLQMTMPDGTVRHHVAATRKNMVTEKEMDGYIAGSDLRLKQKIPAEIWGSSVLYYLLEKPDETQDTGD